MQIVDRENSSPLHITRPPFFRLQPKGPKVRLYVSSGYHPVDDSNHDSCQFRFPILDDPGAVARYRVQIVELEIFSPRFFPVRKDVQVNVQRTS